MKSRFFASRKGSRNLCFEVLEGRTLLTTLNSVASST
jgi:hypothetical protein